MAGTASPGINKPCANIQQCCLPGHYAFCCIRRQTSSGADTAVTWENVPHLSAMGPRGKLLSCHSPLFINRTKVPAGVFSTKTTSQQEDRKITQRSSEYDLYHLAANKQKLPDQVCVFLSNSSVYRSAPCRAHKARPQTMLL